MVDIDNIIKIAIEEDASDIHLVSGRRPTIRIARELIELEKFEILKEPDMYEFYDYFVRGNVDKDEVYKECKQLDLSYEYQEIRLRVNISSADNIPVFTLRLIKKRIT